MFARYHLCKNLFSQTWENTGSYSRVFSYYINFALDIIFYGSSLIKRFFSHLAMMASGLIQERENESRQGNTGKEISRKTTENKIC